MCGICGFIGEGDQKSLEGMRESLSHRGPNDQGLYLFESPKGRVGLAHRRLSILDLSEAGHQPMCDASRKIWISYNGEIYNFKELRAELESRSYSFKSNTDTEVITALWSIEGPSCLQKLQGMFAFAIWDQNKEQLFLVRDRLGIKPLYYTLVHNSLYFSSEIKALLAFPQVRRELNLEALEEYLTFLWVPDPKTLFKGIFKLPPGHFLLWERGNFQVKSYWDLNFQEEEHPLDNWIEELRERLKKVVQKHLISDVPLGLFLSGGLDSSALLAYMAQVSKERPVAFTVGFSAEDQAYEIVPDDLRYARQMAKHFNADYTEILLKPKVVDLLPKVVWHMDEPVADPAAISAYLICQAAKGKLKVLLSGMGGDEVFAGYPRHLATQWALIYQKLPLFLRQRVLEPLLTALPGGQAGRLTAPFRNIRKFIRSASLPFPNVYLGFSSYYTQEERQALFSPHVQAQLNGHRAEAIHEQYLERVAGRPMLDQILYLDLKTYLPCLNLTYMDKMSMAHSIEVRVPYLDHTLVEFAARMPPELKLKGNTRKYILKKAMEGLLPQEIIYRSKAGFTAPIRAWLVKDLRPWVEEMLSERRIRERGLFNSKKVRQMMDENMRGRHDCNYRLWELLTLEIWFQTFLDQKMPHPIA